MLFKRKSNKKSFLQSYINEKKKKLINRVPNNVLRIKKKVITLFLINY